MGTFVLKYLFQKLMDNISVFLWYHIMYKTDII